ncbi:hypothetical protein M3215_01380 [Bacillus cytotoxicus]|uniref:Uncharacterized protein n=1 Tax=Bacillus cytotoxicus TaxID=580165 RepID=A0ACC6A1I8_9BACI|nr:hypothetical protein [Bacillus cytotoxicus]
MNREEADISPTSSQLLFVCIKKYSNRYNKVHKRMMEDTREKYAGIISGKIQRTRIAMLGGMMMIPLILSTIYIYKSNLTFGHTSHRHAKQPPLFV